MKILAIHSSYLEVVPKQKAIERADEEAKAFEVDEALVVFTAVEEDDNLLVVDDLIKEIEDIAKQVKAERIVLYPYVHLTSRPSSPRLAKQVLNKAFEKLKERYEVYKAPFGWYKAFTIKAKGHPLSELSREIRRAKKKEEKEEVSESLKAEARLKSKFYIYTPNDELIPVEEFDFKEHKNLEKLAMYEIAKVRSYEKEPPHIKLMQELEWVGYEPGSDPGNLRFYPKGRLVKKILERAINELCISLGAHEVETPIMYDMEHPSLKKYLNRFPARQYIVLSDDKELFLRFAACFGQFLIAHDATISYKQLPFKLYELTRYSFRREQSGELAGLKRLRAFTMPDMHTFVADINMAVKEFEEQFIKSKDFLESLGLFSYCETAFRIQEDFFNEHRDFYRRIVKLVGKPILVEMFKERYAYFITKFEFNFIDAMNKATALSTVQIDVENAHTYDINYMDKDGNLKKPLILHASLSGAIERVMYAILEKEAMEMEKGRKAKLPLWLSPIQLRLIPVSAERHLEGVLKTVDKIKSRKIRFDVDDSNESLSKKIRKAEKEWIPYIAVIGDKEIESGKLTVSIRETGEKKEMSIEELVNEIEGKQMYFERLNMPWLLSKRVVFRQKRL